MVRATVIHCSGDQLKKPKQETNVFTDQSCDEYRCENRTCLPGLVFFCNKIYCVIDKYEPKVKTKAQDYGYHLFGRGFASSSPGI